MNSSETIKSILMMEFNKSQASTYEIINLFANPIILLTPDFLLVNYNNSLEGIIKISSEILQGTDFIKLCKQVSKNFENIYSQINKIKYQDSIQLAQDIINSLGERYLIKWDIFKLDKIYHNGIQIVLIGNIQEKLSRETIEKNTLEQFYKVVTMVTQNSLNSESFSSEISNKYDFVSQIIQYLPDCSYAKTKDFRYLDGNQYMLDNICGFLTKDDLVGKDDYFLNKFIGRRWPETFYLSIRQDDILVVEHGIPLINKLEPGFLSMDGKVIIQSATKLPLRDETNKIIGLFGISLDISEKLSYLDLYKSYNQLHQNDQIAHENFLKHVLKVNKDDHFNQLTVSELNCLVYFSSGLTHKEVAKQLSLSPRTIEAHISRTKEKLGVSNKSELIRIFNKKNNFHE